MFGGLHAAGPFLFGQCGERFRCVQLVTRSGVRHDATETHAAFVQASRHRHQSVLVVGPDARAVAIAVDFDPHLEDFVVFLAEVRDGRCRRRVVDEDLQLAALAAHRQHLGQLGRRDADGVEDVDDAGGEELLGFLEGGDGDALRARF